MLARISQFFAILAFSLGLCAVSFDSARAAVAATPSVMTFQTWKNLRLEEAKLVLDRLTFENQTDRTAFVDRAPGERQAVIKTAPEAASRAAMPRATTVVAQKTSSRPDSRIEQARINLEIAQDLSITDYLQIYLPQVKSRDSLLDVARRMTPEEVVELMVSYQKLSSGGQIAEHSILPGAPHVR